MITLKASQLVPCFGLGTMPGSTTLVIANFWLEQVGGELQTSGPRYHAHQPPSASPGEAWAEREAKLHMALASYCRYRFQRNRGTRLECTFSNFVEGGSKSLCLVLQPFEVLRLLQNNACPKSRLVQEGARGDVDDQGGYQGKL